MHSRGAPRRSREVLDALVLAVCGRLERLRGPTPSVSVSFRTCVALFATVLVLSILGACREEPAKPVGVDAPRVLDSASTLQPNPLPRIDRRPDGPVLVLPEAMERALLAEVPGFTHSLVSDYDSDLQQYAAPSETSALFAAIGDFNGDGRADVAVDGHDATHGYLLVLLTEPESIRVFTVRKAPLGSTDQRTGRIDFLSLVPRGLIQADTLEDGEYEKVPVRLEHDAFDLAWFEKASTLYYWRGGRFVNWVTSD